MTTASLTKVRIRSIDILRGIIMLIMALDHTRDYFHWPTFQPGFNPVDLSVTTPAIFFTRWITHFCAPTFLFLSGVSAYLSGKNKSKKELSSFLIKRGIWLILVELVILSFIYTFDPLYHAIFFTVFWAIGWSMIILGILVRGSFKLVVIAGLILFLGHNILDYVTPTFGRVGNFLLNIWFTTSGTVLPIGANRFILFAYAILPWTGLMLLGYGAGSWYANGFDAARRKRLLLTVGFSAILLFIILRFTGWYGDPTHFSGQKNALYTFMSYINTTKYPVSLQYSLMTLGPGLIALALLESVSNPLSRFVTVYGRVPFFYYVGHFLLIHILCTIAFFVTGHSMSEAFTPQVPFGFRPVNFGWPLWVVYLVWLGVILFFYYPCVWFWNYKLKNRKWWVSYM